MSIYVVFQGEVSCVTVERYMALPTFIAARSYAFFDLAKAVAEMRRQRGTMAGRS